MFPISQKKYYFLYDQQKVAKLLVKKPHLYVTPCKFSPMLKCSVLRDEGLQFYRGEQSFCQSVFAQHSGKEKCPLYSLWNFHSLLLFLRNSVKTQRQPHLFTNWLTKRDSCIVKILKTFCCKNPGEHQIHFLRACCIFLNNWLLKLASNKVIMKLSFTSVLCLLSLMELYFTNSYLVSPLCN